MKLRIKDPFTKEEGNYEIVITDENVIEQDKNYMVCFSVSKLIKKNITIDFQDGFDDNGNVIINKKKIDFLKKIINKKIIIPKKRYDKIKKVRKSKTLDFLIKKWVNKKFKKA